MHKELNAFRNDLLKKHNYGIEHFSSFRKSEIYYEAYSIIEKKSLDPFNLFINFLNEDSFEFLYNKLNKNQDRKGEYYHWLKKQIQEGKITKQKYWDIRFIQ